MAKKRVHERASERSGAQGWRRAPALVAMAATVSSSLLLFGCGPYCQGPSCGCEGDEECILSCERDGCDLWCSHTASTCGAICGDDCAFVCDNTNHCSALTGDGSNIDCHSVANCAGECGADCHYSASNVSEGHITVGPNSTVACTSMALCSVTCVGACEVSCDNVSRCEVDCDGERASGDGGRYVCD